MLTTPAISVVFPARDEGARVRPTVASIIETCEAPHEIEVVIVDDCSKPAGQPDVSGLVDRGVQVRVIRSDAHLGVGAARNLAVRHARGDVVCITDAHVRFSPSWDQEVRRLIAPHRILAASIRNRDSTSWRSFGCRLVVPHMGTYWNTSPPVSAPYVQIASSAGTVLERALFQRIGGYDEGMLHYGGFEPEFSVRAWCSEAEIIITPGIEITHRFKPVDERVAFVEAARTAIVHNCLRFGVAYLPESMILEMVRLHAAEFPNHIQCALRLLEQRDAWRRRDELAETLARDFGWFVERFGLRDQVGRPIPVAATWNGETLESDRPVATSTLPSSP
ncbi:glycosyl transferase family 2 [Streptomyces venezuelae]|uniref:Glycosyl transferase family 2 n=1 Tax=Streptomyces venezuelae TaxID=54571 RepID=A0A5P2D9X6_STRVZ|nr:glycosyltransferase [Streptomyces venezuelae]QES51915.1 glycosyl transferase family 2 [Streptomyces venezuelae]